MREDEIDQALTMIEHYKKNRRKRIKPYTQYYNELDRGDYRGIRWYMGHNDMGHRTGYIRVPRTHPWFGLDTNELPDIDVHGGVSWADKGPPGRVPRFSYEWWVGFDCAHAWDLADPELVPKELALEWDKMKELSGGTVDVAKMLLEGFTFGDSVLRTHEYVHQEIIRLASQAYYVDSLVAIDDRPIVGHDDP